MISGAGIADLIKALSASTSHRDSIRAIMSLINFSVQPAEGYEDWFNGLYLFRSHIHSAAAGKGIELPITEPVWIQASVYRDAERGDFNGYTDAIADAIQADEWKCGHCKKKTIVLAGCPHCRGPICGMSHARKGLGLIGNDSQIVHWDGTRLYKDAQRPRVELVIRTIPPAQGGLF